MNEIYTRVSTRKFEDRPVEAEKITQLLKAAMQAPSAGNQQPWEFYVVTDKEKINALSEISPYASCAKNAPVVIVPCYRTDGLRWNETVLLDLSCATENLLLEAVSLGLGTVWLCGEWTNSRFYDIIRIEKGRRSECEEQELKKVENVRSAEV